MGLLLSQSENADRGVAANSPTDEPGGQVPRNFRHVPPGQRPSPRLVYGRNHARTATLRRHGVLFKRKARDDLTGDALTWSAGNE